MIVIGVAAHKRTHYTRRGVQSLRWLWALVAFTVTAAPGPRRLTDTPPAWLVMSVRDAIVERCRGEQHSQLLELRLLSGFRGRRPAAIAEPGAAAHFSAARSAHRTCRPHLTPRQWCGPPDTPTLKLACR
jgi:hypothetical protein